jgi:cytochrome c-type biogenesis protein CcmH
MLRSRTYRNRRFATVVSVRRVSFRPLLGSTSLRATRRWPRVVCALLAVWVLVAGACDRKIEPFDPNEKPREPDLSKIFPEGADSAEPAQPGLPPAPGQRGGGAPGAEEGSSAPVSGTVVLAPEFEGKTPENAVLFIIARNGAGPPLAVKRISQPRFPVEFSIGPEDRMIQERPFAGPIELAARIDRDGNATTRSPGDVTGTAAGGPVQPGATGLVIVLDTAL